MTERPWAALSGASFALALSAAACTSPDVAGSRCALAAGQVVARSPGLGFDDLALLPVGRGEELRALWSDTSGLWWRRLQADGTAQGPAVRLGERCAGGLAAAFSVEAGGSAREQDVEAGGSAREQNKYALWLACVRPAAQADETGELRLVRYAADGQLQSELVVGAPGRDGRGVALAVSGSRVQLVYHEGSLGRHVVHRAIVENGALTSDSVISNAARVGAEPALFAEDSHVYALWSEAELSGEPQSRSAIWLKRDDEPARKVFETHVLEAAPSLSRAGEQLVLAVRDQTAQDKRSELYLLPLNRELHPVAAPVRIGRANTEGPPRLLRCGTLHAALLPREYGGERYVAVHQLDERLQNLGGGHQYYANTREFVRGAAACGNSGLTLLIGERANPAQPGVELMTLRFSCH